MKKRAGDFFFSNNEPWIISKDFGNILAFSEIENVQSKNSGLKFN